MDNLKYYQPILRSHAEPTSPPMLSQADLGAAVVVRAVNWLGDNLISMAALYQLRCSLTSEVPLVMLGKVKWQPLWQMADWLAGSVVFAGRRADAAAVAELGRWQPGVALVLPNSLGSAWDVSGRGVPIRIGRAGRGRRLLLSHCLPAWRAGWRDSHEHQVNHYFDLCEVLRPVKRELPDRPMLKVEEAMLRQMRTRLDVAGASSRPLLALAPGAAYGPAKQWPAEYYGRVAQHFSRAGYAVVLVGTAGEREMSRVIGGNLDASVNLCGQTTLPELAACLRLATACLCNDSGVMHLAAAVGRPGVAVFGSTSARATGPLANNWVVLDGGSEGSPCFQRRCGRKTDPYACLRKTTPEAVCRALEWVMGGSENNA